MNVQNTTVTANADGGATMRLHGNVIARMNTPARTKWTLSGAILAREPFAAAPGGWRWTVTRTRGRFIGYTDSPILVFCTGRVAWTWPELFTRHQRCQVTRIIAREYRRATNGRGR